jgi:hypothetical protein
LTNNWIIIRILLLSYQFTNITVTLVGKEAGSISGEYRDRLSLIELEYVKFFDKLNNMMLFPLVEQ